MTTRVANDGRIAIPKPVREHVGIRTGSLIEFEMIEGGRIVLNKLGAKAPPSRFARIRGRATVKMMTGEILALTRGDV